jgi:hypothetical protein
MNSCDCGASKLGYKDGSIGHASWCSSLKKDYADIRQKGLNFKVLYNHLDNFYKQGIIDSFKIKVKGNTVDCEYFLKLTQPVDFIKFEV